VVVHSTPLATAKTAWSVFRHDFRALVLLLSVAAARLLRKTLRCDSTAAPGAAFLALASWELTRILPCVRAGMFLSRAAFDDEPADKSSRPKTGGFNTVSRTLARPGTSSGEGTEGTTYSRHATVSCVARRSSLISVAFASLHVTVCPRFTVMIPCSEWNGVFQTVGWPRCWQTADR
jgi:hypothetical protein